MSEGGSKADSAGTEGAEGYYGARRVRRSLKHFLVGGGINSIASIAVALLIVRQLSVGDYAGYTALGGLTMTLTMLTALGTARIMPRYFPVLRQADADRELRRLFWGLLGMRTTALAVALGVVMFAGAAVSKALGLPPAREVLPAFTAYVFAFALSMQVVGSLQALLLNREMARGTALEWVSKLAVLAVYVKMTGGLSLTEALWIQSGTAAAGLLYMVWALQRHFAVQPAASKAEKVLDYAAVRRLGTQGYLGTLMGLHTSPGAVKLIGAYQLSALGTASLGFAYAMTNVVKRYLPATLLLGLIEPTVMARYGERRDFGQLARLVSVVLKINLFILLPITGWLMLSGGPLVSLVAGGKYADSATLMGLMMIVLIMQSHGLIMQLICNAVERTDLLVRSAIWSWLLLPVMLAGGIFLGASGLLLGLLAIALTRNIYVVYRLRGLGYSYRPEWAGILRIVVIAVASAAAGAGVSGLLQPGIVAAFVAAAVTGVLFLMVAYAWKPFTTPERDTLNRFIGRRLFVW